MEPAHSLCNGGDIKNKDPHGREGVYTPADKFQHALASAFSNLYSTFAGDGGSNFTSLSVHRRGNGDWLALCKVTTYPGLEKWIAFGAGEDFTRALEGLNRTIAAGKWKEDRPYTPRSAKDSPFG